ncbi:1-deoxy-D-xylulose-5-phosphate reductoisomerase [Bacillus alkalicellulosilyticus]|uniref:1-deoxy-D-xylulose-5-phosphate reductoisomerase n=1 Tax=Alkalihalobacterium alkalicellulosilyticum TaxID=1912214 RepID=UPI000998A040|nr:1-deoxy-D-xylulose-5-phosphate reductoisomerase [Bacillus alkalicellulosilyticus]
MNKISLLGATGSIGTQTLDVIRTHPEQFKLVAMSIGNNMELALQQIHEFQPKIVSVISKENYEKIRTDVPSTVKLVYGDEGILEVATFHEADILVNAVIGSVGLVPTLAAIAEKKTIAIANKETLVTAGHIVMDNAVKYGVKLLPVDSEHSAIYQCLQGERMDKLSKIILTASGGSFRDKSREELQEVTVKEALNHPNWSMGAKITIDSATMMNKGLEVIEAHWLFNLPYNQIEVILHKESIIHSMVEFIDGSVIAQLGTPDMKVPIQYALSHPTRLDLPSNERLNLWEIGKLHFEKPDFERYRCLALAFEAGKIGGTMTTVLNAANEVAVASFLEGSITFLDIEKYIEHALTSHQSISQPSLEEILAIDKETRAYVTSLIR